MDRGQFSRLTRLYTALILPFFFSFAAGLCNADTVDLETRLFNLYAAGDLNTLQNLLTQVSDTSAAGQFFKGAFESDGETARFYYDRVVVNWPGSQAEGWALEKLWQYQFARGNLKQAEKYWNFLSDRHADHPCLSDKPDFETESELLQQSRIPVGVHVSPNLRREGWGVQVGAFSKRAGAEATARRVEHFGSVLLLPKTVKGKQVTAVIVSGFRNRNEAARMAETIKTATGLKGRVVSLNN